MVWRIARVGLAVVAVGVLGAVAALYVAISNPRDAVRALPAGHVGLDSEAGATLLRQSARADHDALSPVQRQEKATWCGVASAVTVLRALGQEVDQSGLFEPAEASAVRSWARVTFSGMPISDLAGLLEAHGAEASVHHAGLSTLPAFRAEVARNSSEPGDYLIVNYDRAVVGEEGGGHISPVSAYHAEQDRVLLLDTATYKYPPHWIPLQDLYAAMNTLDPETGATRGWVVVD